MIAGQGLLYILVVSHGLGWSLSPRYGGLTQRLRAAKKAQTERPTTRRMA